MPLLHNTLHIPLEIPSQNQTERGRNWRARAGQTRDRRNAWALLCRSQMALLGIEKATGPRKLTIFAFRKRLCTDIANLIGGAKACVDGLVDAGLIQDDRDSKARIVYEQHLAKEIHGTSSKPFTMIHVEELPP